MVGTFDWATSAAGIYPKEIFSRTKMYVPENLFQYCLQSQNIKNYLDVQREQINKTLIHSVPSEMEIDCS